MTRNEMLKKMGLTHEELKDLMGKFSTFHASLNESQKKTLARAMPTLEQSARSFGSDVTVEHIQSFVTDTGGVFGLSSCIMAHTEPFPE